MDRLRPDEFDVLLDNLQVDENSRQRALTLFAELQSDPVLWRLPSVMQKGSVSSQLRYVSILEQTRHLRVFCSTLINGLLQTREYARANMRRELEMAGALSQLDEACLAKARVQECLYDAERSFEFVIHESSFSLTPATPDVMAAQAEKLIHVSTLPNVDVYFVPAGTPMNCPAHYDFVVFDDVMVLLEMWPTAVAVRSPAYIDFCLTLHERLTYQAIAGDDARDRLLVLAERLLEDMSSKDDVS